jgi:hypothetical protein
MFRLLAPLRVKISLQNQITVIEARVLPPLTLANISAFDHSITAVEERVFLPLILKHM